jgi:zinc/manganese transport system substrate-binding protein
VLALACAVAALLLAPAAATAGRLRVVTTIEDLAAIARAVGGDEVDVFSLSRGFQDPHYVAAKPSLSRKLHDADLLIYAGLQLEIGWLPLLVDGARNPQVRVGQSGNLAASRDIRILEIPTGEVDRSQGDVHPEGNPHYWLDPRNGLVIARTIAERLAVLRPERRQVFESGLQAFSTDLERRIAEWEERLAPWRGAQLVAYHQQWEYLLDWTGIRNLGYIEDRFGIPPSPKHVQLLIAQMTSERVPIVIHADFICEKIPQQVAERGGAVRVPLPASVGSRPEIRTYFDLFDAIVSELERSPSSD